MPETSSLYRFISEAINTSHPVLKLILLLFGMLTSLFLVNLIGMLLAIPLFHMGWHEIQEIVNSNYESADIAFIKYFQSIQSIGFFLLPGFLLPYLLLQERSGHIQFFDRKSRVNYLFILALLFFSAPFINSLVLWNSNIALPESMSAIEETVKKLEEEANAITVKLLFGSSLFQFFINLLIVAVLPSIGEELIFRRIIQPIINDWLHNIHLAIVITGVLFSVFHVQFYGFFPRLALGIYFGYLYFWSGNITTAVWAHFLNNSLALSLNYLSRSGPERFEKILGGETLYQAPVLIISLVTSTILVVLIWQVNQRDFFRKKI